MGKNYHFILKNLLNNNLILPLFIRECFDAFCQNKQQIVFDMHSINRDNSDKKILNLLFHSLDKRDTAKVKESKRSPDDFSNLLRGDLLALFPNVKTLIIRSTRGESSFSFSLMAFLDV